MVSMRYLKIVILLSFTIIASYLGAQTPKPAAPASLASGSSGSGGGTELKFSPIWIQALPELNIPLGDSSSYFGMGLGGSIAGEYRLPFFPMAFARAGLDYGDYTIPAKQTVSMASLGMGLGVSYNFVPNIGVKAYADGGATYGFLNATGTGNINPFFKTGLDLYASFPPKLIVSLGTSFNDQIGLYSGLGLSLGASFGLGAPIAVQKFKPAAPKPLINRPQLLKSSIKSGSGIEFTSLNINDIYQIGRAHV
jgi:hypothetical protein